MNYLILILMAIVLFGLRFYYIIKKKINFNLKELFVFLFLFYLLIFIKITLLKDEKFTLSLVSMIKQGQFIPSLRFTNEYMQLIKTIFITIPFGFFISVIFLNSINYKKLLQYGFLISFIIEILKLFKLNEVWNINQILLMTAGFLIGGLIYQLIYKLLKLINKETWLDTLKGFHQQPIKKTFKLACSLIIIYIIGVYACLVYQTYPLSILNNAKVINIDQFKIEIEEKLSQLTINGYYQTNFNRLKRLYVAKFDLNQEPIYGVYTLVEPYKPQTDVCYGILVVGWTDKHISIQISYENQSYTRKLSPGLFTVGYPQAVNNRPILDLYADSNPDHNLSITFYDESGNVIDIPYYKETLDE